MTAPAAKALILSHQDAFSNLKTLELYGNVDKKNVHTFGVRGKHFVLIQKTDGLLTRVWNSFLKLLGIIGTNDKSINRLKDATVTHIGQKDYIEWADKNHKVTKLGLKELKQSIGDREKELKCQSEACEQLKKKVEELSKQPPAPPAAPPAPLQPDVVKLESELKKANKTIHLKDVEICEQKKLIERREEELIAPVQKELEATKTENKTLQGRVGRRDRTIKKLEDSNKKLERSKAFHSKILHLLHPDLKATKAEVATEGAALAEGQTAERFSITRYAKQHFPALFGELNEAYPKPKKSKSADEKLDDFINREQALSQPALV